MKHSGNYTGSEMNGMFCVIGSVSRDSSADAEDSLAPVCVKNLFHHYKRGNWNYRKVCIGYKSSPPLSHKVGGAQVETQQEQQDAVQRGKATSAVIGTREVGTRYK